MARVKKKDHEKLSDANLRHVISLLNPEDGTKPITKKAACEILNISYNTTRLNKIIEEFLERERYTAERKAANRGKAASEFEIQESVKDYLNGDTISDIAKALYRSAGFVKAIIERVGVPTKPTSAEGKHRAALLPEQCVRDSFEVGEVVWSARHHRPALIRAKLEGYYGKYGCDAYRLYVMESVDSDGTFFEHITTGGFNAVSLAYDIGYLGHLKEFGVSLDNI